MSALSILLSGVGKVTFKQDTAVFKINQIRRITIEEFMAELELSHETTLKI